MTREFLRLQKNCVKVLNNINKSAYGASSDIWYFAHTIQMIKQNSFRKMCYFRHYHYISHNEFVYKQKFYWPIQFMKELQKKASHFHFANLALYFWVFNGTELNICPSENDIIKVARGVAIYWKVGGREVTIFVAILWKWW